MRRRIGVNSPLGYIQLIDCQRRDLKMQIYINGAEKQIPDNTDMVGLIEQLELTEQRIAVEVNEELIPRSTFSGHHLHTGDKVEIIHAVGGG